MPALAMRLSLGMALLASGCVGASPPYTEQDLKDALREPRGIWYAALEREGYCEFPSPGMI
jgi:hypothetical protein